MKFPAMQLIIQMGKTISPAITQIEQTVVQYDEIASAGNADQVP
jgi:hypothetical protein